MARPPRFLENPRAHAALSDPGETSAPGHFGASVLPSIKGTMLALTTSLISGFNCRSLRTPCVRFAAEVALGPRNTRYRLVATFAGQVCLLLGSIERFRFFTSSFPRLLLAQPLPEPSGGCVERSRTTWPERDGRLLLLLP